MPIIRYQIRNEYGLADPELYGAADKEDPEALLEGVAMAGLVGVLRQLGDLAEFAAEIFHDLHEEMMATASRGHALMLRVQQLEAEFPAIEKSFLSQTDDSNCTYNTGIDWHPNLQIDHNLITREDMPRFILDSYEESRGPPRLFVLDKFDIAGDGACLKRYSDPSFFKMNLDASGKMEPDIPREKKSRKNKKKMQRWRNGETPESYIPHVNLKLESVASEKAPENPLVKLVKLKTRQLKENASIGRIYMEHILEKQSSDHIHLSDNSVSNSQVNMKIIDSTELAPEVREVVMDTSTCKPFSRERNQTELHSKEELNFAQKEETVSDKKDREILQNEKKEETENLPPTFHKADQKELLDEADCKREGNDDAESRTNGSLDGYISDDVASELDSYLDALTTMDSEIETDNDTKAKPEPSFFSKEYNLGSNANEQRRLITESLDSHTFRKSSSTQSSLTKEMPAYPNGDSFGSLANSTPPHRTSRALLGMFMDAKAPADEAHDTNFKNNKVNSEVSGNESSTNLVPKQMTTDIVCTLTESGVESSTNHTTETTVALIHSSLRSSSGDVQSATANQNIIPRSATSTENIGKCHDGEYTPSNLDAEDPNVLLSNPVEGHKNGPEKLLEDDFHQRSEESRGPITEDDYVNSGHISKNTEILSGTPLHLGDESDLNIWIQDDPSFETLVVVPCTEELSAEGITSMPSDSYSTQMHKDINLETSTSSCVEDLPLSLSVSNEEEFHGLVCQDPEIYSAESTLSRKCSPVIPPNNNPSIFICDGLLGPADNSILSNETFECEKSSTSSEDATYFAEDKAAIPQSMGSTAENEERDSGISLPGPFFVMKMHQESSSSDQVEFTPKDVLPDIMKVPLNASVCETGDSRVSTGDHSNLLGGVIPFSSPMELLPSERDSPCLVTECIETDKLCSATLYTQESSFNYTNLQEESFSTDSVLEQQQLEAAETSSPKDLTDMDVQQVLHTSASHEDHVVITGPCDSESAGHILDSSSQHDSGEPTYDCHTETFDPAEDLCPGDGNKAAAISLEEVEGGELLNPIMENESKSTNSGIDHYVGNIETSISEDLTRGYDQKASTIAFLEQEVDDVVTVPGDSKSGEPVDDSFNHTDLKPPTYVLCPEDPKSALSPQNSRTEDRLPEPSDTSDFESVKDAEILEANEAITYTLERQVSHSEPLLSGEACQTLSGDAFLSHDVSAESISPSKEVFALQSSNESDVIFLQQKIGRLDLSDIQLERGLPLELDDNKIESQPLVPEIAHDSVEAVSSHMIYQLDMASTNESSLNQLEVEVDSPLQSSFGISACSAISHAPLSSLQTFPSLGSSSAMILLRSSELPLDEDPPLPPLPPLQWRVGKLQPTTFMPNGEMAQPQSGPNHLTALPSLDHSGGSLVMGGAGVQPPYPFSEVQELPNNSNQFGYQTVEAEGVNPFQLSGLSPAVEAQKCQDDVLPVDVQLKHIPATSSFVVSHLEDGQQKHELCQDALSGDVPQSLNPFMSPLPFSDARSQQFPTALEGEPIEQPKSSDSLPTLVFLESEHGTASIETAITPPSNPFLSSTSTEFENFQYNSGTFGVRMVQNQNFPDPLSTTEIAAPYILISQGENTQALEGVALSTEEYGKPNGRLCSLLNRPRHPLMEAVASHDKSTLRRVSELVHPSARTEDERNSLLEQIRNKSFNLKPATVTKPNMKGPTTNLKVAAILEKANAIRQAFVGSDEDDDGDSWSDS